LSSGWLSVRDDIVRDDSWFGVHLQPDLPTRWEEFDLARTFAKQLKPGRAWDAGTGVTANQHILPMILAGMGWDVVASDIDPRTLEMPSHPNVTREVGDLTYPPYPDSSFDAVFCISTLEHLRDSDREMFMKQADRVLKPGGVICITADELAPAWLLGRLPGYHHGERVADGVDLSPAVSFVLAQKPKA
jgi:ubiquinone/menaquinone biosynthesis C-methylase UbiE